MLPIINCAVSVPLCWVAKTETSNPVTAAPLPPGSAALAAPTFKARPLLTLLHSGTPTPRALNSCISYQLPLHLVIHRHLTFHTSIPKWTTFIPPNSVLCLPSPPYKRWPLHAKRGYAIPHISRGTPAFSPLGVFQPSGPSKPRSRLQPSRLQSLSRLTCPAGLMVHPPSKVLPTRPVHYGSRWALQLLNPGNVSPNGGVPWHQIAKT